MQVVLFTPADRSSRREAVVVSRMGERSGREGQSMNSELDEQRVGMGGREEETREGGGTSRGTS